jgi:hypothetical protein
MVAQDQNTAVGYQHQKPISQATPQKKACVAFLGCENNDDRPRNQSIYSQEIVKFDNVLGARQRAPGATVLVKPGDVARGSVRAGSMEVFCGF